MWKQFKDHLEAVNTYLPYVIDNQCENLDPHAIQQTKRFINLMAITYGIIDYEKQLSFLNEIVDECIGTKNTKILQIHNTYDYIENWNKLYPDQKWENVLDVDLEQNDQRSSAKHNVQIVVH